MLEKTWTMTVHRDWQPLSHLLQEQLLQHCCHWKPTCLHRADAWGIQQGTFGDRDSCGLSSFGLMVISAVKLPIGLTRHSGSLRMGSATKFYNLLHLFVGNRKDKIHGRSIKAVFGGAPRTGRPASQLSHPKLGFEGAVSAASWSVFYRRDKACT